MPELIYLKRNKISVFSSRGYGDTPPPKQKNKKKSK